MRWPTTTGAAATVRLVLIPFGGLVLLFWEASRDQPRVLIVTAAFVAMGLLPAAAIFEGRRGIDPPTRTALPPGGPGDPTPPSPAPPPSPATR